METLHHARKAEGTQLDFTAWVESIRSVAEVLAGFGLVTVVLAYGKHAVERYCWKVFKRRGEEWINEMIDIHDVHPRELSDDEWTVEVERLLMDAYFSPRQIQQLLELGVTVTKGLANERLSW